MRNLYIFIILFLTVCCHSNKDVLDLRKSYGTLKLSSIADSISYIQLETTDECLFGEIRNIQVRNNLFYIYDSQTQAIYMFNRQGKFLSKLYKRGQARDEYTAIQSFSLDSSGNIHVMDLNLRKIIKYNPSGEFMQSVRFKDLPRDFYALDNGDYVLYMPDVNINSMRGLFLFDSEKYTEIFSIDGDHTFLMRWPILNQDKYQVIAEHYNSNIYYMNGKQILEKIHFNITPLAFGRYRYNEGFCIRRIRDTYNFLLIIFGSGLDVMKYYFYDKQTKTGQLYDKIENDLDDTDLIKETRLSPDNTMIYWRYNEEDTDKNPQLIIVHLKNE